MKIHPIFFISVFFFISCSSTHFIKSDDSSFNEVNERLKGEKCTIELVNGEEIVENNIKVESDSTTVGERKISTKTIKEIVIKNHGTGALKGMGYGLLSTSILSGILYLSSKDEPYSDVVWVIYPPMGLALGGLFGGIHGDIEKLVFPTSKIEVSSVTDTGTGYIIILWQGKKIGLSNSQYYNIEKTRDGKIYIIIPEEIYKEKFQ